MSVTATVRVMSPEEIAARAGGELPALRWPQRGTLFALRAMRLRQLATGHPMGDFLLFMAELAEQQHTALQDVANGLLPDRAAIERAVRAGLPPIPAADWPREPLWQATLREMLHALRSRAPVPTHAVIDGLIDADAEALERQADALLHGVMARLDLAAAPLVAAALQVYWTHLALAVQPDLDARGREVAKAGEPALCPCCGSRPTASVIPGAADVAGQRFLHCSLCNLQWHVPRIRCTHCGGQQHIAYQSLQRAEGESAAATAPAAVQAETCDDCHHYLKIVHLERDPHADPVADDLATLTLDLLVAESGYQRHGVNLMLLFGDPGGSGPDPGAG